VIDLKEGKVSAGTAAKADCTLELTDSDWGDMTSGKADPQKLFSSGKLKITGNVMASQKLDFLKKIDRNATQVAVAVPQASVSSTPSAAHAPMAEKIFAALKERLSKTPALGKEVGGVVTFKVKNPDFSTTIEFVAGGPQATLTLSDEDLTALAKGEATAKDLYMHGALRVDGDVKVAHRLGIFNKLI
jgi:3-hydroxyacyl-CoA dehydrogenase/3a,7a,12a-trihydroxy-5b-cholest-24-enoyl-CoA hydratase